MQTQIRDVKTILVRVERPYQRSPLFQWLLEHHDEVVAAAGGRRVEWSRLCGEFENAGLTGCDGKPANATTARKTWQRVRKERARIEALCAAERAERERRAAENPRRDMPSQFRKGDWGPPLATTSEAPTPGLPATTVQQAQRGFELSTAEGVVVTRAGRVVKTERAVNDYVFEESGMIVGSDFRSSVLRVKQQLNVRGLRPINDSTETLYADLGLVWTKE
jgi:hypothetical protein